MFTWSLNESALLRGSGSWGRGRLLPRRDAGNPTAAGAAKVERRFVKRRQTYLPEGSRHRAEGSRCSSSSHAFGPRAGDLTA